MPKNAAATAATLPSGWRASSSPVAPRRRRITAHATSSVDTAKLGISTKPVAMAPIVLPRVETP